MIDKQFTTELNKDGIHKIGGKVESFNMPDNNFIGGIQYIGEISREDNLFSWLPFDLPIICPIYSDHDGFFVDFKDRTNPKILTPHPSDSLSSAYDEVNENTQITFQENKFSFVEFEGINEDNEFELIGIAGIPYWGVQDEFPILCPEIGEEMKYVCQFTSWSEIPVVESNVTVPKSELSDDLKTLVFWGDGHLRVYFNPISKIACYFIQGT